MSTPSAWAKLRFCPRCGVEAIERDFYAQGGSVREAGHRETISDGCEYVCRICGFGFRIMKSKRVQIADQLHREHRQLRANVKFETKCVGTQIAEAFQRARKAGDAKEG